MANKTKREENRIILENEKKEIRKKLIVKILSICLASIFFLLCVAFVVNTQAPANPRCYHFFCLSTFKGSFDKKGNPHTYWSVEKLQDENGGNVTTFVQVEVDGSYSNVGEIWVNLSDFYEQETQIKIVNGNSKEVGSYALTAKAVKESKNGWFKIFDVGESDSAVTSYKFNVGFSTKINVRELVFLKKDGSVLGYTVQGEKTEAGLISIDDERITENKNSVLNVKDEQDTFKNK